MKRKRQQRWSHWCIIITYKTEIVHGVPIVVKLFILLKYKYDRIILFSINENDVLKMYTRTTHIQ